MTNPKQRLLGTIMFLAFAFSLTGAKAETQPSTYERVVASKTLRCGYLPYEPYISVDPNTGEVSGITHDYFESVAQRNGFKIEWAQDVNIDQLVPTIESGKIDAACIPATPDENWEQVLDFPAYLGSLPYFIYVPKDSTLNKEQLDKARFATQDGFALTDITKNAFPDAIYIGLTQTASTAELYDQLKYKKTDALVNEHISASLYMKNNPDVIRRFSDTPVIAMRMFMLSKKGDKEMTDFLDKTFNVDIPENLAVMKEILKKNKMEKGSLFLGEECIKPETTEKGWRICEQPTPPETIEKEKK
ncbi:MAG TPA: transporter substrate-binding domain-containing protein [Alphaproteobacteria bacterium]|nr:transporter substrate-binding domain-containing protein [Alphaproteobacteria bacterium]